MIHVCVNVCVCECVCVCVIHSGILCSRTRCSSSWYERVFVFIILILSSSFLCSSYCSFFSNVWALVCVRGK